VKVRWLTDTFLTLDADCLTASADEQSSPHTPSSSGMRNSIEQAPFYRTTPNIDG
jgi:hypothetical protein